MAIVVILATTMFFTIHLAVVHDWVVPKVHQGLVSYVHNVGLIEHVLPAASIQ
jgi:hypothetical protein